MNKYVTYTNWTWSIVACILSYSVHKSGWLAVGHFILGAFYVPYWVIMYSKIPELIMKWLVL